MRPRTELALGTALVLALSLAAGAVGLRRARLTDADGRRSTLLAGPSGARAYAEALGRLGVRVETFRRPAGALDTLAHPGTLVAFLGPSRELSAREGRLVARLRDDLLLAGPGAATALRCLGYEVRTRPRDAGDVVHPAGAERGPFPRAGAVLARRPTDLAVDSSGAEDGAPVSCTAPAARAVDTLLRTTGGRPVVLRAALADGRTVTLVADDRLFSNRALREIGRASCRERV